MNIKLKPSLFLRITSLVMVWGMLFAQVVFAGHSIFEVENLSPSVHIHADSFLRVINEAYSSHSSETINVNIPISEQRKSINRHKQEIAKNLKKYSVNWKHDRYMLKTVINIAENELKDKKFPAPTNELFLHHAMEVAFYLSQMQAPVESICTAILHRFEEGELFGLIKGKLPREDVDEILHLMHNFLEIANFYYATMPFAKGKHNLQNFMNYIIQESEKEKNGKSEADERILMIALADVLASVKFAPEKKRNWLNKEIDELWAYLAHRSGLEEVKDKLLNQYFKYSFPAEHKALRELIKINFGMSYEELEEYLEETIEPLIWQYIEKTYGKNQTKIVKVKARLKGLYEIYNKIGLTDSFEKVVEKGVLDDIKDILALRIICDCIPQNLYEYYDIIQETLLEKIEKYDDERKKEFKHELFKNYDPKGAIYLDLKAKDGNFYEVQILTVDYNKREIIRPHWIYKLKKLERKTGQKFDQAERYIVTGDFKADFKRIFNTLKKWIIVFVLEKDKDGVISILPKRLPKGSIMADVAALRNIDRLNSSFSGAQRFAWEKGVFYEGNSVDRGYELHTGDIVMIESNQSPNDKTLINLRKAKTLRAKLVLHLRELNQDLKDDLKIESTLPQKFEAMGVNTKNSAFKKWFNILAVEQGLKNSKELYAALSYFSGELSLTDVIEKARDNGKEIAEAVFETIKKRKPDGFAMGQLAVALGSYGEEDDFYVQVGVGQITPEDIEAKLCQVPRNPPGILDTLLSQIFEITLKLPRKKLSAQKLKTVYTKIENLLNENGWSTGTRIKKEALKKKTSDPNFKIAFFAKVKNKTQINKLKKEILNNYVIKRYTTNKKDIKDEEFFNEIKKNKQVRRWELIIEFSEMGQSKEDLMKYFIDELKRWSPKSELVNLEPGNTMKVIIDSDLNRRSIENNLIKIKKSLASFSTSFDTVCNQTEKMDTLHESNRFSTINSSI